MQIVKNTDGTKFYSLPPKSILYRGNTEQYLGHRSLNSNREFFALDKRVASLYGLVMSYETKIEILLYPMDDVESVKKLYDSAPQEIRRKITSAFGYSDQNQEIFRESDDKLDKDIIDYICSLNLDGYGCMETETDEMTRKFHAEVAICSPTKVLNLSVITKEQYTEDEILDAKFKLRERELKNKRIVKRRKFEEEELF